MKTLAISALLVLLAGLPMSVAEFDPPAPTADAQEGAPTVERTGAPEPTAPAAEEDDGFVPPADLPDGWYVRIETRYGRIIARLLPEQSPQAVAHFAGLAGGTIPWTDPISGESRTGHYYDGVPIFKAEAGRLFETGDWTATGKGAPQLYINDEGRGPVNFNGSYRLGMARYGMHISAVQFFVTVGSAPSLVGRFPCFGSVVRGQQVVFQISQAKTVHSGRPVDPIELDKVRVFTIGDFEQLPEVQPYEPVQRRRLELREGYRRR